MTDTSHDPGVIHALVERLNTQRLPRALDLKKKVDAGETLGEYDMNFLESVFHDAETLKPLMNRNPGISEAGGEHHQALQGNRGQGHGEREEGLISFVFINR